MTGTPAHSPEPVGHWAAARHREFLDGLGQYLDPDAGLRDIMLHAGHTGVIGVLGSHLDTQAGLAAILPPSAEAPPRSPGQSGTAAAIAATDPAVRMALRRSPVILAAILSDLTIRALTIADGAHDGLGLGGIARDRARDRAASALARDLDRARDLARELGHDLGLGGIASASNLASELASVLALASDRDRAASALGLDLDRARDLARDLALASGRDLDLDRARGFARQMALMVSDALGIGQTEELAAALLEGALDDFTRADLARADLTGRDLTGIRWSDWGTTWPPGTDTSALRERSREVADGSGIYVITGPGHDDKALNLTSA